MARRLTAAQAAVVLRGDDRKQLLATLQALPDDVDPELAAGVLLHHFFDARSSWGFARGFKKLPAPVIRAVLQRFEGNTSAFSIFVRVYTAGEADLCAAWERAMFRLLSLDTTYAWGSKQRRAKFDALAAEPRVVEAIQAAVVANAIVRVDALAVLSIEASEASVDALMPHFERAARDKDRGLDRLQALKKYASKTPAMTQMLARVDAILEERKATSPALDLARHIGLGELKLFWFHNYFGSTLTSSRQVPMFQAHVTVDSRESDWFVVSISKGDGTSDRGTWFNSEKVHRDTLELGACTGEQLPAWFRAAAKKHRFQWNFGEHGGRSNLRGARRDRIRQWLEEGK